jgi:uncharacterized protein YndB with AHSA1/START domain
LTGICELGNGAVTFDADVRVGGSYRHVLRSGAGHTFAFSGTYTEVTPHTRLVYTQIFEPTASGTAPGETGISVTVTFDEQDGGTRVVELVQCPSKEVRDAILASGMEHGMRESMDQLDELVASLR